MKILRNLATGLSLIALAGCANISSQKGYIIPKGLLEQEKKEAVFERYIAGLDNGLFLIGREIADGRIKELKKMTGRDYEFVDVENYLDKTMLERKDNVLLAPKWIRK